MGKHSFKNSSWKSKTNKTSTKARKQKNPKQVLKLESKRFPKLDMNRPTYLSIKASPPLKPTKKYCDISGLESKYTDPKTGLRFCNTSTFHIIQVLTSSDVQKYLGLRRAALFLR
eukprot:TRINITY_DN1023_c0_g1_i1.p1 TRINITY_DN1023_c0_g1~~TRINITY_DN1023_c0_g1_i1.p1  ORF type:complete len:115 (+),score=13.44 TRINITY_DN1023_c0_g1_i1:58-402(+)